MKKLNCVFYRSGGFLFCAAGPDAIDVLGEFRQFFAFVIYFLFPNRRQNNGQRLGVSEAEKGGKLVADSVRAPVSYNAAA